MGYENFSYDSVSVECNPKRVAVSYATDRRNLSKEDVSFLELTVAEAQEGRVEKRHASASDHADNVCH